MNITVEIRGVTQTITIFSGTTGKDVLAQLNFKPDGIIMVVNGKPIPYTELLKHGDTVKIFQVASGG